MTRVGTEPPVPRITVDISPPLRPDPALFDAIIPLDPDSYCVAYAPGRAARADSAFVAASLQARTGRPAAFVLATRDHNSIGLTSLILGAYLHGIRRVVVVAGQLLSARDRQFAQAVGQVRPTELIQLIQSLNQGRDFRGNSISVPSPIVVGGTIDPSRQIEREVELAGRKAAAGADYFLAQAVADLDYLPLFREEYRRRHGLIPPTIVVGIEIPIAGGVSFGRTPDWIAADLVAGRPGSEIAIQLVIEHWRRGERSFYLVAPILKGGERRYADLQPVIREIRRLAESTS